MNCPGLHCPGCKDIPAGAVVAVAGAVVVVVVVLEFLAEIMAVAGTLTALMLAGITVKLVCLHREGQLVRPLVAVHRPNAIRPVSEHPPVAARPVQAFQGPREVHYHHHQHLYVNGAQAAEAITSSERR